MRMMLVFSIMMMMNVMVNREKGSGGMNGRQTNSDAGRRETRTRRRSLRSTERPCAPALCVDALDHGLSRVHTCSNGCSQHTLGCITRRDLYSRLTSLCEGRIRSDTSLVCTHDSTVRLPLIFSLSISQSSFFPNLLLVRSFGGFTVMACTRSYRHFRHRRDSTRGSN